MNIVKKISLFMVMMATGTIILLSFAPAAGAIDVLNEACGTAGSNNAVCKGKSDNLESTMKKVINMLLYVVGIVSVVSIIIGGIMYTTSTGDQGKVTSAKNTILYSVIGLIVSILAFAIVNFVVTNIG